MIDLRISNDKLQNRAVNIISKLTLENMSKIKSSMLKWNQIKKDFFIFHCVHYFFVSIIKC